MSDKINIIVEKRVTNVTVSDTQNTVTETHAGEVKTTDKVNITVSGGRGPAGAGAARKFYKLHFERGGNFLGNISTVTETNTTGLIIVPQSRDGGSMSLRGPSGWMDSILNITYYCLTPPMVSDKLNYWVDNDNQPNELVFDIYYNASFYKIIIETL